MAPATPRVFAGRRFRFAGRVMALVDVYDAVHTRRLYHEPLTHDEVVAFIVKGRGTHFDPAVVDAFVEGLARAPGPVGERRSPGDRVNPLRVFSYPDGRLRISIAAADVRSTVRNTVAVAILAASLSGHAGNLAWAQSPAPAAPPQTAAVPSTIPLFPLPDVVLFPDVALPLRIFEPRYRAMVADAIKGNHIIGMVLLQPGHEADYEGRPPIFPVGCAGVITQVEQLPNGEYTLVLRGLQKFRVMSEDPGGAYRVAHITPLPEPPPDEPQTAAIRTERQRVAVAAGSSGHRARACDTLRRGPRRRPGADPGAHAARVAGAARARRCAGAASVPGRPVGGADAPGRQPGGAMAPATISSELGVTLRQPRLPGWLFRELQQRRQRQRCRSLLRGTGVPYAFS